MSEGRSQLESPFPAIQKTRWEEGKVTIGLDITMGDLASMQVVERIQHLPGHGLDGQLGERTVLVDQGTQVTARDELHDDVHGVLLDEMLDVLDDVGVAQALHDGHLGVELAIGRVVLAKLSLAELLGGEDIAIIFVGHSIDGGKGPLSDRAHDVVLGSSSPGLGQSTARMGESLCDGIRDRRRRRVRHAQELGLWRSRADQRRPQENEGSRGVEIPLTG